MAFVLMSLSEIVSKESSWILESVGILPGAVKYMCGHSGKVDTLLGSHLSTQEGHDLCDLEKVPAFRIRPCSLQQSQWVFGQWMQSVQMEYDGKAFISHQAHSTANHIPGFCTKSSKGNNPQKNNCIIQRNVLIWNFRIV